MRSDALQRGFAEFVGTFALVFVGAGSIAATGGQDLTAIALAHGLVIGVMVSAVGHISGGHFNPAVTLGFLVTRRIEARLAAAYWFAQLTAAILGALLLRAVLPERSADPVNLGAPGLGAGVSAGQGLMIEIILTFFLVWVIFATAADPRGSFRSIAGLAIGFTISLDIPRNRCRSGRIRLRVPVPPPDGACAGRAARDRGRRARRGPRRSELDLV